jgi:predicted dehydrogenase
MWYNIDTKEREVHNMTTYTIYLGATPIATTDGTDYTYAVWRRTVELAELIGTTASLVWDETREVVEEYDPDQLEFTEPNEDEDFEDDVDESGFDPYEGCYTYDC